MNNPICFALDVSTYKDAQNFCDQLGPFVGAFKVGLELFVATGMLPRTQRPIVLDLKLHDIPETVSRTIRAAKRMSSSIKYMTLHIQQKETLRVAVLAAAEADITLLGVTVLTSMVGTDLEDLRFADMVPGYRAQKLAMFASEQGLNGFVCSPNEAAEVKASLPRKPFLLVPGIRPAGSAEGDQKRTGTPKAAIQAGADLLVVGRPIRDAADPVKAAKAILEEVRDET